MKVKKQRFRACVLAAVLAVVAVDAAAQMRRDRGSSTKDSSQAQHHDAAPSQEPFAALERELPSLNIDLLLSAGQVELWRAFEHDVRDMAEMDRAQHRHLLALREGGEGSPTAVLVIASLVEDERMKSDALGDLKRHLDTLYAALGDNQKRTLDRRVVMSQAEPLGR
jgi:hypothetical protein